MTYLKNFKTYDKAFFFMTMKNKAFEKANNKKDMICLVPGPDNNFALVDHRTASELGSGYVFAVSGYVNNPF